MVRSHMLDGPCSPPTHEALHAFSKFQEAQILLGEERAFDMVCFRSDPTNMGVSMLPPLNSSLDCLFGLRGPTDKHHDEIASPRGP